MEVIVQKPEDYKDDRERQAYYDLVTLFSESVPGYMHTSFPLTLYKGDLYAPDGRGLDEVTTNGYRTAVEAAKKDESLLFDVERRILERQERWVAVKMASGKGPNTLIVLSDFPGALQDAEEDVAGYNVTRKQCMARTYVRLADGSVIMHSQTLDGSNRVALEAIYNRFGMKPDEGMLLGQRIQADLSPEAQASINDEIVRIYDKSMVEQFGGEWYAGRRPADFRNTYDFVCQQTDIITRYVNLSVHGQLREDALYDALATLKRRFKVISNGATSMIPRLTTVNDASLTHELETSGRQARSNGEVYSYCGDTLRPEGFMTASGFEIAGFGNNAEDQTGTGQCKYNSRYCPNCLKRNVVTTVTKTHISGSCGCVEERGLKPAA